MDIGEFKNDPIYSELRDITKRGLLDNSMIMHSVMAVSAISVMLYITNIGLFNVEPIALLALTFAIPFILIIRKSIRLHKLQEFDKDRKVLITLKPLLCEFAHQKTQLIEWDLLEECYQADVDNLRKDNLYSDLSNAIDVMVRCI